MKPDCPDASTPNRILIVSDAHPRACPGLSQIASGRLFEELRNVDGLEVFFLATAQDMLDRPPGVSIFQPFGPHEFIITTHGFDPFFGSNADTDFPENFETVLRRIEPDLVHFRDLGVIGIEAVGHVRRTLPSAGIVITLSPLCIARAASVRTAKSSANDLVVKAYFEARFPERTRNDELLRELYIRRFLQDADAFIVADEFTAENSLAQPCTVDRIYNGDEGALAPARDAAGTPKHREFVIGIFGPEPEGLQVFRQAVEILATWIRMPAQFRFEVYWTQGAEMIGDLGRWVEGQSTVDLHYLKHASEIGSRIQSAHMLLIPDAVCKDAPYLVAIARAMRRPLICPDAGSVAALVQPDVDGFHFSRSNGAALAGLLADLALEPDSIDRVAETMAESCMFEDVTEKTLAVYRSAMTQRRQLTPAEA